MTCEAQLCAAGFGLGDGRPIASASHVGEKVTVTAQFAGDGLISINAFRS
ncbi:MAG: hypothetical protein JWO04_1130 [Gammaproteobacteria bacterium]|jgi:hypothetical protein|nr:hypothetical protein [Gammaproteobacteria bacterium]